jgi:8-oxo-dGTP pyrophosphatase MutT (NUDIX family)
LQEAAVLREAVEETGLEQLQLVSYLGRDEYHLPSSNPDEIHLRHFYHLSCKQETPVSWHHYDVARSDDTADPILFDFYWLPLIEAGETLHPYFSAKLDQLLEIMAEDKAEG